MIGLQECRRKMFKVYFIILNFFISSISIATDNAFSTGLSAEDMTSLEQRLVELEERMGKLGSFSDENNTQAALGIADEVLATPQILTVVDYPSQSSSLDNINDGTQKINQSESRRHLAGRIGVHNSVGGNHIDLSINTKRSIEVSDQDSTVATNIEVMDRSDAITGNYRYSILKVGGIAYRYDSNSGLAPTQSDIGTFISKAKIMLQDRLKFLSRTIAHTITSAN